MTPKNIISMFGSLIHYVQSTYGTMSSGIMNFWLGENGHNVINIAFCHGHRPIVT